MSSYNDQYGALEVLLKDILLAIKPLEEDVTTRVHIINEFTAVVNSLESLRGATVEPFGSFVSNLYTKWGDLDISIEVQSGPVYSSTGKRRKVKLLGDLQRALRNRGVARQLEFIRNARVPVLKFESHHRNVSCDISVSNFLGQIKSKLLFWIADIDERFRDMVLLIKEWAKTQDINDPKTGTLNSYSLALLVIFHFQTCEPAILPPLHEIYTGDISNDLTGPGEITEKLIQENCAANITKFRARKVGNINKSSLAELFTSFFQKFSTINTMAAEHVICTHTGQWELRRDSVLWMSKTYPLLIEDPFEHMENTARAVSPDRLQRIAGAFVSTYGTLATNKDRSSLIATLVEWHIRPSLPGQKRRTNMSGGPHHPHQFAQPLGSFFPKTLQFHNTVRPTQNQLLRFETHPNQNASPQRPQLWNTAHQPQNQFQNMRIETRPFADVSLQGAQSHNTVRPTQNQLLRFETHPNQNASPQRPQLRNTAHPPQNQFQNMRIETRPFADVSLQGAQSHNTVHPVGHQLYNFHHQNQSSSNAFSTQEVRARPEQRWRPKYSES